MRIYVPAYEGMTAGQRVTLNVYLEGYYQNSPYVRHGFVKYRHEVMQDEVPTGLVVVIDQNDLTGYGLSPRGLPGTFTAQYVVASAEPARSAHSKPLMAPIATTVPYKESTWVALTAQGGPDDEENRSLPRI